MSQPNCDPARHFSRFMRTGPTIGHNRLRNHRAFAIRTRSHIARTARLYRPGSRTLAASPVPTGPTVTASGADYWFMHTHRVPTQPQVLTSCQPLPSHSYL